MRVSEPVEDTSETSAASESSADEAGSSSASDSEEEQVGCQAKPACLYDQAGYMNIALCVQGADIPFEHLVKMQQDGSFVPGAAAKGGKMQAQPKSWTTRTFKRENKNRPVEQTSKRPVPRHRQVMDTSKP